MKILKLISLNLLLITVSVTVNAESYTRVAVGEAELKQDIVYFAAAESKGSLTEAQKHAVKELITLFEEDFKMYKKLFEVKKLQSGNLKTPGINKYDFWKAREIDYLVETEIVFKPNTGKATVTLHDLHNRQIKYQKELPFSLHNLRKIGHKLSNGMYHSITGKESIFESKFVFVSDRTTRGRDINKELYIMDYDGRNVRRLTTHGGTVISPAISYDGNLILYSLIKDTATKKRNVNLYIYDLRTNSSRLLSSRRGVNSGAIFLPDGEHIALTMSHVGNTEIFSMNLKTRAIRRITRNYAVDVDPSISSDGKIMSFLSGRPGKPMIYTLDPSGTEKNVKRVSYVGRFNATPRFSPDGTQIVFASWLENCFDLFRINVDGSGLSRLTKNFGSNEDPTYSKDGQFIAFSSQRVISRRKAVHNIYIMDKDGEILKKVSNKYGNCITPRWSK